MSGETTLTVVGNLAADPELRFTPSGDAVANFSVASTPRVFKNNEWVDGETLWMRCAVWKEQAESVAELTKGTRVVVTGKLKQRSYEKDGVSHTVIEMEADEVAASLKYANVKVERRQSNRQAQPQQQQSRPQAGKWQGETAMKQQGSKDPWADDAWGSDEPPF
jgi:single-strand DNA-binding protein